MTVSKKIKLDLAGKLLRADFLTEREKDVLKMRLGLEGYAPATLQKIGDKYQITRERARQIGSAIARKIKKFMPEEKIFAGQIFAKSWEPKYFVKERYLVRRRAVIKRNRTIVRNKSRKLAGYIEEYAVTKQGKQRISSLFKELRIKFRKNKSLFEPDVVIEIKNLRQCWKDIRKKKPVTQQPLPPIQQPPVPPSTDEII